MVYYSRTNSHALKQIADSPLLREGASDKIVLAYGVSGIQQSGNDACISKNDCTPLSRTALAAETMKNHIESLKTTENYG